MSVVPCDLYDVASVPMCLWLVHMHVYLYTRKHVSLASSLLLVVCWYHVVMEVVFP